MKLYWIILQKQNYVVLNKLCEFQLLNWYFGLDGSLVYASLTKSNPKKALYFNNGNHFLYNIY